MSATAKKFSRGVASKRYVRASVKDKFAREYEGLDEEPTTVEIEASHAKVFETHRVTRVYTVLQTR